MTTHPGHWTTRAACAGRPDLPWTTDTAGLTAGQVEAMRAVCHTCPVMFECLAAVDALDITGGWWAGADRDPYAAPIPAPEWAGAPALEWVPVHAPGRCGRLLAEQAAFDFTRLGAGERVA